MKSKKMETLRIKSHGRDRAIDLIIGGNIKRMRAARRLSQEKLGVLLGGITFQQIQKYERGANSVASCRVPQLVRALDCTLEELFEGSLEGRKAARPFPEMSAAAIRLAAELDKLPKLRGAFQSLLSAVKEEE